MNTPLYKLAEKNFGIISNYYDLIRQKAEKYYLFITKFKSATKDYCNNINNLFKNEVGEENLDLNKENSQRKRASSNIMKVNGDLNENAMKTKNLNISPIENNIEQINKLFENYFECLQLFVDSLETHSGTLNKNIENAKQIFNRIKDSYSNTKITFSQKYADFEQLNKKMSSLYYDQEKTIIEFLIKNKLPTTKEKEYDLNLKIFEGLENQKEWKNSFIKLGNFGKEFNDSYEANFNEIKNATIEFYNQFEAVIKLISTIYQKSFLSKIKEFANNINNNAKMQGKDFKEFLNHNLKVIDPKLANISFDLYKINTIKCNTKEESHLVENNKNLINVIRNSSLKKIDDKEIFYVARKMNNFEFIDKKEYVIEIEKEKLKLRDKLLILFHYANQSKVKNNNDKNNENKLNNNNENKDNKQEEDKIDNNEKKEDEPNQEDVNYICKLMKKKEYRDFLLTKLNNFRAESSLVMAENIYNIFVKIFLEIMKYLVEEKEKELNIDYSATRYIFILSQTFFYKKEGKKIYLQEGIKDQKIFQSDEFWIKLLQYNIKKEVEKLASKSQKKFDEKEKGKEVCIMQILPYLSGFKGFGVNKETADKVINFFIKEYELNEESQKLIFEAMKISENE